MRWAGWRRSRPSERRWSEHLVKRRALAFQRRVNRLKTIHPDRTEKPDAASCLSLGRACLDHWRREWRRGNLVPRRRGRPSADAGGEARAMVEELLVRVGPSVSAATLANIFPELGVKEARCLLGEYRENCRDGMKALVTALEWLRPGTVWAMDHAEPPTPVDGEFPQILVVRDLASRHQLCALPQRQATAGATADALEELFVRHGAPLALKSDNGGAFAGLEVQTLLARWGVRQLLSPPYLPRYNGAVEAGIGQLKTRVHIIASQHNRPGRWSADDLEGARLLANRSLRPWGLNGPTPEERWSNREGIGQSERDKLRGLEKHFQAKYSRQPPDDFRNWRGQAPPLRIEGDEKSLPEWARRWNGEYRKDGDAWGARAGNSQIDAGQGGSPGLYYRRLRRRSLTDAMVAMGLLVIRKRVIPLPIKRIMRLKIS